MSMGQLAASAMMEGVVGAGTTAQMINGANNYVSTVVNSMKVENARTFANMAGEWVKLGAEGQGQAHQLSGVYRIDGG